jgi:hypothetical protein
MSDALQDLQQKAQDALGMDSRPWHEKFLDAAGDAWKGLQDNISGAGNQVENASTAIQESLKEENKKAWLAPVSLDRQREIVQLEKNNDENFRKIREDLQGFASVMNTAAGTPTGLGSGADNVALTIYKHTHDLKMPNVIAPALTEVILPNIMPAIGGIWGKAMESMQNGGGFPKGIPAAIGTGFQEIVGYFDIDKLKNQIIEQRVTKISEELQANGFTNEVASELVGKNVYLVALKEAELTNVNQNFLDNLGKTDTIAVQPVSNAASQIPKEVANQAVLASNGNISAVQSTEDTTVQEVPTALSRTNTIQI